MNMTNSEMRSLSVPRETNGQDQTTPEHVTVASVSLSVPLKLTIRSMDEIFIGTDSYKLGTGTPTFGTRFHHICTMLYQVPPLWYHGTTTLSPPSEEGSYVRGHRQTIFVTVNGIGPLGGGEGVQLKSVKIFTFLMKIEISNISLSILKE